ncbi:neurotrypsin-like [Mercenaria mercenaria]|uniref:neurotrypsin-like n=1 Tax=Mercenaria mercenaria TaxID=6596 RepID=UPI00234F6EE5|nr:neurotrypsin-like [Mercenaria mercenaria]
MFFMCIAFGIITESVFSVNAQATDIRLGNETGLELKPYEGRIEVFIDGEWGSIGRHGVDNVTAKIVCKILGYGYIGFRVERFQYTGRRRLSRLKCAGHETSILECQQEVGSPHGAFDAPGVHCFDHVFTEVRLSGGKKATEGMVQVKMDGRWGRVCSYDQSSGTIPVPTVFLAICRTLGFQNYDLQNSFKGADYDGVELSWLDLHYVSCTGEETHFNQCTFEDVTMYQPRCYVNLVIGCITTLSQYCSSDDICAGVDNAFCLDNKCACKEGYIQTGPRQCSAAFTFRLFKTSELYDEGLVEVYTSGNWSLVSGGHLTFNDATAKVLCQTLGYGFVGFSTWMYYYSGLNYTGYLAYKVFQCDGSPPDATECFDNIWYEMSLSDGTSVTRLHCYGNFSVHFLPIIL